jgi:hypothetical protein
VGPLASARTLLGASSARRTAAERAVDQRWADAARRAVQLRIITPLDVETSQLAAAMEVLDVQLVRALTALDD